MLRLLEQILESDLSNLLTNEVVSEVVQTCLPLACNKKRSEVLRRAAEMSMFLITFRIFSQLKEIDAANVVVGLDELQGNFSQTVLPEDVIGGTSEGEPGHNESGEKEIATETGDADTVQESGEAGRKSTESNSTTTSSEAIHGATDTTGDSDPFGIICINEFLRILISMISPSNQFQYMESTRVFALLLINTAIEVSGEEISTHPSLMILVSDSICKHILQIMTTSESPALLQASLQLFTTTAIVLGKQVKSQVELTLTLIFSSIFPEITKKSAKDASLKTNTNEPVSVRLSSSKEMLIESISILWTRSPIFFTELFIKYDCDFDSSDLSSKLIENLCQLSLPESANITTDNVPPICLESILSFISSINDRIKKTSSTSNKHSTPASVHKLIDDKDHKMAFVKCTELLNENPKEGLKLLKDKGFIKNLEDQREIAGFFFSKSGRLNKKVLGEFLAKPSNIELLTNFISFFEFGGLRVDEALRILLKGFRLPGESQQIERIVETFAERYVECQVEEDKKTEIESEATVGEADEDEKEVVRPDRDAVFILSYSIILLNTDLHNPQVKKQMDLESYKRNLRGIYNGKDFPAWYLSKIYQAISDREIIMPEEHHGTDKWFDDAWNNIISSQVSTGEETTSIEEIDDLETIIQFDKLLFAETVDKIINTLIKVFKEASDDHIITRLMSSIDKCASICLYFGLDKSIDSLINELADQTRLTNDKYRSSASNDSDNNDSVAEIPITQIQIDKGNTDVITVSDMAVWFGREFKAQISMVVLFRVVKKIEFKITPSWNKIIKIILALFENCLINPNLFLDFQSRLNMSALPKVKPRYVINRTKPLKDSGLLSTFSSFLKGYLDVPPEPTDQEVESTLSTIDCVKSINIPGVFENVATKSTPEDLKQFINFFVELLPSHNETKNKRFYESETLFMFEIISCFALLLNDVDIINQSVLLLSAYSGKKEISKKGQLRLSTYKLLLIRKSKTNIELVKTLSSAILELLEFDNDSLVKNGAQLLPALISLGDSDECWCKGQLLRLESYWTIFRILSTVSSNSQPILEFLTEIIGDKSAKEEINPANYMIFLGLLDELSSLGAIGSQFEQKLVDEHPVEIISLSKKSISLTTNLSTIANRDEFKGKEVTYSLYQALAHQCFNPCREIRTYAITQLQLSILQIDISKDSEISAAGIFEYVLFPLLAELSKDEVILTDPTGFVKTRLEVSSLVSKVFLNFSNNFQENELESVWLNILNNLISFKELKYSSKNSPNPEDRSQTPVDEDQETETEILKNLILVLQSNEILVRERVNFWNETSKRIEALDSGLRESLIPDIVQEKKDNVEDKKDEKRDEKNGEEVKGEEVKGDEVK